MNTQLIDSTSAPLPRNERRRQPLSSAVSVALELYFEQLGGQKPDNLYRMVLDEVERPLLQCVMNHCGGNQSKAAQFLGLNRGTLRKKLKLYGLERETPPFSLDR